jgi:hypothetical protein
MLEECQILLSL